MDPLIIIALATVVTGVLALVAVRSNHKRAMDSKRLVEEAKKRAQERARTRGTESEYTGPISYDYHLSLAGTEVHDRWDGRDYLDDNQKQIIGRIMADVVDPWKNTR